MFKFMTIDGVASLSKLFASSTVSAVQLSLHALTDSCHKYTYGSDKILPVSYLNIELFYFISTFCILSYANSHSRVCKTCVFTKSVRR